jgi:hypothetical protein
MESKSDHKQGGSAGPSGLEAMPPTVEGCQQELLSLLRKQPRGTANQSSPRVRALIEHLERERPADLGRDGALLPGVWELAWNDGNQPYLKVAPWLENLQILDPRRGRGMNLLRLSGPLGALAGIAVQAQIEVEGDQRVSVLFRRGGWLGPTWGSSRLQLLRDVNQSTPAWLDITVLDEELRICRGNAGTLFALLRRKDLEIEALFPPAEA